MDNNSFSSETTNFTTPDNFWEYAMVEAYDDHAVRINGTKIIQGYVKTYDQYPFLVSYLNMLGGIGWEVVGTCPSSESGRDWRIILKRRLAPKQ